MFRSGLSFSNSIVMLTRCIFDLFYAITLRGGELISISDTNAIISIDDLDYAYPNAQVNALDNINLSVNRGEIFGLLGPSGAGKSTLQRILTRQIRRTSKGQVSILGRDISQWDQSLYERIGIGFELPNHYLRLTGLENLQFFSKLYKLKTRDPMELLDLVGLAEHAKKRVERYSKGMQVRLNFVRAIMHDPELLFLDEPTSGLDPTTSANLKSIITSLRGDGKSVVLTTHNMTDADELCDRVGFIANGQLTALDAPEHLKTQYGQRNVTVQMGDGRKQEFALDNLGENPQFQALLKSGPVKSIHSQEASLAQVFKIVTGMNLFSGSSE